MSDYKLKNICDFDLAQTLECGQCFHFVKLDENDYVLTAKGRLLHVSQQADTVTFYDTEEDEYVNIILTWTGIIRKLRINCWKRMIS